MVEKCPEGEHDFEQDDDTGEWICARCPERLPPDAPCE